MKSLYQSKTFWVGVLQVVIGISTAVLGSLNAGTTITIFGIAQIILRVLTDTPIQL